MEGIWEMVMAYLLIIFKIYLPFTSAEDST